MTHAQLAYDLPVIVQFTGGRVIQCRSHAIGKDGITVKFPTNVAVGAQCRLHFNILNDGRPHSITTEAVVTLSALVGEEDLFHLRLRFKQLDPQQQRYLDAFIHERKGG